MSLKKYLTCIGPIAAGKGTQSEKISGKYGFAHISTGQLFRNEIAAGTEVGRIAVKEGMNDGILVDDETTNALVKKTLSAIDLSKGFVFDGYPRRLAQAIACDEILAEFGIGLDRVILLNIPEEEIIRRVSGRYQCTACKAVYNDGGNPPKVAGVCDVCGGRQFQCRADDRPELVKTRLEQYWKEINPILDYYREKGIISEIDASINPEVTFAAIEKVVEGA